MAEWEHFRNLNLISTIIIWLWKAEMYCKHPFFFFLQTFISVSYCDKTSNQDILGR